jgi:hypothetical protein
MPNPAMSDFAAMSRANTLEIFPEEGLEEIIPEEGSEEIEATQEVRGCDWSHRS